MPGKRFICCCVLRLRKYYQTHTRSSKFKDIVRSSSTRIELSLEALSAISLQNHNDSQGLLAQILCELRDSGSSRQQREGCDAQACLR